MDDKLLNNIQSARQTQSAASVELWNVRLGLLRSVGDYQALLMKHGMVSSMSRKGDCWDNAVVESFFATLKTELVDDADWETREKARTAIFEYIEAFYNRVRRHSSLGYVSPAEYEQAE